MSKRTPDRTLRIIGGNWRGRKVSFPDREAIRPTPDRVRETLFNWLQTFTAGSRFLELYAGSGLLGMEALSRGAGKVTFIERDRETLTVLATNLRQLGAEPERYECIKADARAWLASQSAQFDIILLDPPFGSDELTGLLPILPAYLAPGGLVYIESGAALTSGQLPEALAIVRQKRAGNVHYCLCEYVLSPASV